MLLRIVIARYRQDCKEVLLMLRDHLYCLESGARAFVSLGTRSLGARAFVSLFCTMLDHFFHHV